MSSHTEHCVFKRKNVQERIRHAEREAKIEVSRARDLEHLTTVIKLSTAQKHILELQRGAARSSPLSPLSPPQSPRFGQRSGILEKRKSPPDLDGDHKRNKLQQSGAGETVQFSLIGLKQSTHTLKASTDLTIAGLKEEHFKRDGVSPDMYRLSLNDVLLLPECFKLADLNLNPQSKLVAVSIQDVERDRKPGQSLSNLPPAQPSTQQLEWKLQVILAWSSDTYEIDDINLDPRLGTFGMVKRLFNGRQKTKGFIDDLPPCDVYTLEHGELMDYQLVKARLQKPTTIYLVPREYVDRITSN
ncbi:hypothetical protein HDU93_005776 [Gonapodya sp. JEL0774]|nr:hypothetical protein HDU93_005776 [Gonapodya sp. JEL0774]